MKLLLTATAEADLADIFGWLSTESSETTARRIVGEILGRFDSVLQFPESGALRDRLRPGLRVIFQHGYACYYLRQQDSIIVIRVLHGARDTAALADAGGFAG